MTELCRPRILGEFGINIRKHKHLLMCVHAHEHFIDIFEF